VRAVSHLAEGSPTDTGSARRPLAHLEESSNSTSRKQATEQASDRSREQQQHRHTYPGGEGAVDHVAVVVGPDGDAETPGDHVPDIGRAGDASSMVT